MVIELLISIGKRETAGEHHTRFSISGRYVNQHRSGTRAANDVYGRQTKRIAEAKYSPVTIHWFLLCLLRSFIIIIIIFIEFSHVHFTS